MRHTFGAMNTSFLTAGIPSEKAAELEHWVRQLEGRLSRFQSTS